MKRTKIQEAIDHIAKVRKASKLYKDAYLIRVCTTALEALCEKRDREKDPRLTQEDKPPCYLKERTNNPYPLCVGRGFKACAHCCLWADFDEDQDESRVNLPLTLEELREMNGEPIYTTRLGWRICYGLSAYDGVLSMKIGNGHRIPMHGYGEIWFAYRRKPEEGTP